MEEWNMKILFSIFLFTFVIIIIFYPLNASGTEQPRHDEARKNYSNDQLKRHIEIVSQDLVVGSPKFDVNKTSGKINSSSNPGFKSVDNQSGKVSFGLSSFSKDQFKSCNPGFKCIANFSTGWNDDTSIQFSTNNTNKQSKIIGEEVDVKPKEKFHLVVHMKLNKWATQSQVKLEGFNQTSIEWDKIEQCPSGDGAKGPREWKEYSCLVIIPENTTKIRTVLEAGWSSQPTKEATTWYDSIYVIKVYPFIADPNLKAEIVQQGLDFPVSMAFLGPNDFLVLEWHKGTVQRIVNGTALPKPLLDVNVSSGGERGLLGIALAKNTSKSQTGINKESTYVFLYFTAAEKDGGKPLDNRLYRYELVDNKLVNPKLILELPQGWRHNSGKILMGPDKYLYVMTGEAPFNKSTSKNRAMNYEGIDAEEPNGHGGILRIDQNGEVTDTHGILGDEEPLKKYYAYGIRNSFGMDFDPLTGKLWETENGPDFGDEINLVEPGFNSGFKKVQGIWNIPTRDKKGDLAPEMPSNLVNFSGKGKYSPPEFTWNDTVGPTAIKFLSTDKLGKQYENDMFVGDAKYGRIYHFELNKNRTALLLEGPLIDKVADNDRELGNVLFAQGIGGEITDLEIGPDGYLYAVALDTGEIYRIVPRHSN
jgi:glucose/arabinose dehydrogenase